MKKIELKLGIISNKFNQVHNLKDLAVMNPVDIQRQKEEENK